MEPDPLERTPSLLASIAVSGAKLAFITSVAYGAVTLIALIVHA